MNAAASIHAIYRRYFAGMSAFNIRADVTAAGRRCTACNIRAIRREGARSEITLHELLSEAAASTRVRNLRRRGSE